MRSGWAPPPAGASLLHELGDKLLEGARGLACTRDRHPFDLLAGGGQVRSGPHCAPVGAVGTTADCGDLAGFSSDGRYAYWAKVQYSATPRRADLWGFDTATGSAFQVAAGLAQDANSSWPETSAAGGTLAWLAHPAAGSAELNTMPIAASLPNAPEAAPGPGRRLFPETQHSLGGEFRAFWERSGGLAVFGYPLTPAAMERLPTGETLLVQWFERARFEYHPESAAPYAMLLGRLAAEQVEGFGWR